MIVTESAFTLFLDYIKENLFFPSYSARKKTSFRYLRGQGLEIGALQHPLEVPPGVVVKYVDYATREENVKKYPEIDGSRIVVTDHVDDGFELSCIQAASQDFIIANHVLEHAPNPLQVLLNWSNALKRNGFLFMTLPNADKSFDKGRMITTVEHIVEDYELVKVGELETFAARNRAHYKEFVNISIPNLKKVHRNLKTYRTEADKNAYVDKLMRQSSVDAHFHVFTKSSLVSIMNHLVAHYLTDLALREVVRSRFGFEYVVVLEKTG
ncbi:MAG: hypothetical protein A2X83_02660 [Desulfuromonadales bacterium GWD2_54_10]|nr:MAG: hypothetical protein A2X83_02660 [Desulfuromonadales bacterium GWD2_54_10]